MKDRSMCIVSTAKYVQLCDTKLHNYRESGQHKRGAWMEEERRVVMDMGRDETKQNGAVGKGID